MELLKFLKCLYYIRKAFIFTERRANVSDEVEYILVFNVFRHQ